MNDPNALLAFGPFGLRKRGLLVVKSSYSSDLIEPIVVFIQP